MQRIMAKEFAKAFYKSQAWQNCRQSYIKSRTLIDGGMCEVCGKQLGYIVHHKTKLTAQNISNPNISLGHDNLQFVCKDCHDNVHFHDIHKTSELKCAFDEKGQPIDKRNI